MSKTISTIKKYLNTVRRTLGYCLELFLVNIALLTIPRMPRKWILKLAKAIGFISRTLGPRAFRVALANLDIVYGDTKTDEEKRNIAKASYTHFGLVILEYFWLMNNTVERLTTHTQCEDPVLERWISGNFPGLFVTAHIGNWEVGGQYIAMRNRTMTSVYRPIGTAKTLKKLLSFRKATGQNVIPRTGAMPNLVRAIRNKNLIAILLDQHTEIREGGIYIDFFGVPATFSGAVGVLTNRLKVPICVAAVIRNPETDKYELHSELELTLADTESMSPEEITRVIVEAISSMIKKYPEQWLWSYRRWKRYRSIDDPSRFPFYSKIDPLYKE